MGHLVYPFGDFVRVDRRWSTSSIHLKISSELIDDGSPRLSTILPAVEDLLFIVAIYRTYKPFSILICSFVDVLTWMYSTSRC